MLRELEHPTDGRVETGAVQFGSDWPGLWVRGDNAFDLMLAMREVLTVVSPTSLPGRTLKRYVELIEQDVIVR